MIFIVFVVGNIYCDKYFIRVCVDVGDFGVFNFCVVMGIVC